MVSTPSENEVYCRDCGEVISEKAEICPECGVRQKEPEFQQPAQPQKQKDSGIAAIASFLVPGLGQVYNGQIAKGIIAGIIVILSAITVIGLVIAVPLWIWLVYDAYKTAEQINLQATAGGVQANATTGGGASVDPSQYNKVISVLDWHRKNGEEAGLTKDTIRRFKRGPAPHELSDRDRSRIIEAIRLHEEEFGADKELTKFRDKLEE